MKPNNTLFNYIMSGMNELLDEQVIDKNQKKKISAKMRSLVGEGKLMTLANYKDKIKPDTSKHTIYLWTKPNPKTKEVKLDHVVVDGLILAANNKRNKGLKARGYGDKRLKNKKPVTVKKKRSKTVPKLHTEIA